MALIKTNPQAEVSVGFDTVKAGTYLMRIPDVLDRNPEKNDIKVTLEYTDISSLVTIDEKPVVNPGKLFDYVSLDGSLNNSGKSNQWKLRTLVEACGLPWGDFDPVVDLRGREVLVAVKLDTYEGEQRNKVGRYIIPKG